MNFTSGASHTSTPLVLHLFLGRAQYIPFLGLEQQLHHLAGLSFLIRTWLYTTAFQLCKLSHDDIMLMKLYIRRQGKPLVPSCSLPLLEGGGAEAPAKPCLEPEVTTWSLLRVRKFSSRPVATFLESHMKAQQQHHANLQETEVAKQQRYASPGKRELPNTPSEVRDPAEGIRYIVMYTRRKSN